VDSPPGRWGAAVFTEADTLDALREAILMAR
jgi:hypothetical protein